MAEKVASNVTSKIVEMSAVVDSYVGPVLKNNYFKGALFLFFGLYAGFLAPALPNSVLHFFDTVVGKLLFIFLIAFIATRQIDGSIGIALIVAVMFLLTLTILNNVKMNESFRNLGMEHFELMNQMRDVVSEQFAEETSGTNKGTGMQATGEKGAGEKGAGEKAAGEKATGTTDTTTEGNASMQPNMKKQCQTWFNELPPNKQMEMCSSIAPPKPPAKAPAKAPPAEEAGKSAEYFESQYANFDL